MLRHLLTLEDLSTEDIRRIFAIAADIKSKYLGGLREPILPGRTLALLFEKPSLRTRVSFEAGMAHLGGNTLYLGSDVGWGTREAPADFSRVLGGYVDAVVCRAKSHETVATLARYSGCPVINGLTDRSHPCQALADLLTLDELVGDLAGRKLAFIGDANNVARSLAWGCARLGMRFAIAAPRGYQFDAEFVQRLKNKVGGVKLSITHDAEEAVADATAVYTDVWASMGQEAEAEKRRRDFAAYQVNTRLMGKAPGDAYFLHCLPAHRGEEVTDEVIDGPRSVVLQQAKNRMHVQKGVLVWLLGPRV